MKKNAKSLAGNQQSELLGILKIRFQKNTALHKGIRWDDVERRLFENPGQLWSLNEMELTGGEPDVIGQEKHTGGFIFFDCSPESPKGRRSVCYDRGAWLSRKEHKPKTSAMEMAADMGVEILTEEQYRHLQTLGAFDLKTSSWVLTPESVRNLGGGIFCDRRFNRVFTYHNGAESYYASRGFRSVLKI